MKELQKKVRIVLKEIEQQFKSEEDIEFAKTKILELYEMFANELEKTQEKYSNRIDVIGTKYSFLETKIKEVENSINKLREDIYIEDKEEYDLDIICPYCDSELTIDTSDKLKKSITCPECHNVIELDWNDANECDYNCSECHNNHVIEEKEEDEDM